MTTLHPKRSEKQAQCPRLRMRPHTPNVEQVLLVMCGRILVLVMGLWIWGVQGGHGAGLWLVQSDSRTEDGVGWEARERVTRDWPVRGERAIGEPAESREFERIGRAMKVGFAGAKADLKGEMFSPGPPLPRFARGARWEVRPC